MMGELNYFLGLQVKQLKDGIFISQTKYAKDMLNKFNLKPSEKNAKIPMSIGTKMTYTESDKSVEEHKYRKLIDSLQVELIYNMQLVCVQDFKQILCSHITTLH